MACNLRFHPSLNGFVSLEPLEAAADPRQAPASGAREPADSAERPPMMGESEVLPRRPVPGGIVEDENTDTENGPHADFASCYCAAHRIRSEQYVVAVLRRTLSFRALWLGFPTLLLERGIFAADRDFLAQVGRAATMDRYFELEELFRRRCGRRSFGRDRLRLRVSTQRLRRLVAETFARARQP